MHMTCTNGITGKETNPKVSYRNLYGSSSPSNPFPAMQRVQEHKIVMKRFTETDLGKEKSPGVLTSQENHEAKDF